MIQPDENPIFWGEFILHYPYAYAVSPREQYNNLCYLVISTPIRCNNDHLESPLEISLRSQRRENSLARIIAKTTTASFQYLHLKEENNGAYDKRKTAFVLAN
jgi:hypothetical protein